MTTEMRSTRNWIEEGKLQVMEVIVTQLLNTRNATFHLLIMGSGLEVISIIKVAMSLRRVAETIGKMWFAIIIL